MQLRKPKKEDQNKLMDYILEHYINGEMNISASNSMPTMPYEDWLKKLKQDEKGNNKEWGTSETSILLVDEKVVGMLNIRNTLPQDKRDKYGDIGYGVRPTERKKGYATHILKEALKKCKRKGMQEVILGCYEDNEGSKKTILNNNGVFYRKDKLEDKDSLYYKITL